MNAPLLDEKMELNLEENRNSWKILIYDDSTSNLLSYLKTGDLRENNITMHFHIKVQKEELLGVEAIYFISPLETSIDLFLNDMKKNFFESISLVFSSFIQKNHLEDLTKKIIQLGKTSVIKNILQFNLDFYPISEKCLTFLQEEKQNKSSELAQKILNLIYFIGKLPIFVYEKQNSFAQEVFSLLKENYNSEKFVKNPLKNDKRVLFFLKEDIEPIPYYLVHSFKYLCLIIDNFNLCKNSKQFSTFQIEDQKISLDFANDHFLAENKFLDYPIVGENVYNSLEKWKQKYEKFTQQNQSESDSDFAENFNEALDTLPQISEEKKSNQTHVKISSTLMKIIDKRNLEKFCVISSNLLKNKKFKGDEFQETINLFNNKELNLEDKLRLFLIITQFCQIQEKNFIELEKAFIENSTISSFYKNFMQKMKIEKFQNKSESNSLISSLKNQSSNLLTKMLGTNYIFRTTQITSSLFQNKNVLDSFEFNHLEESNDEMLIQNIQEFFIITLNGGNLTEYTELIDLQKQMNLNIYYCMDKMLNWEDFFETLKEINQFNNGKQKLKKSNFIRQIFL